MITVNDLVFSYTRKPFIEGISFDVKDGEIFGFLGPSGAGKSTMQKILIGLLPRYSGHVLVDGEEAKRRGQRILRKDRRRFRVSEPLRKADGQGKSSVFRVAVQQTQGYRRAA